MSKIESFSLGGEVMKKKGLVLLGALGLVLGVASCQQETFEYALITDVGDIDDESFNQTSWEALRDFAQENDKTYQYYRPTEDSTAARLVSIEQAVQRGAKIVVCPGYLFEDAVYEAQTRYPEVKFVLIDGQPHSAGTEDNPAVYDTADNTVSVIFKEEISGFLAGYAAVMNGNTKLGFCGGMAVPAVQRFGSGFIQGADYAATQLELAQDTIELRYYYAGQFAATPEATAKMQSWYAAGIETIFASGGKVYQSVETACDETTNGTWIGVDTDQSSVDERVLTSAIKGLRESVLSALEVYNNDEWSTIGGEDYTLGLASTFGELEARDYVGIPTDDDVWARFEQYKKGENSFTKTQYEKVLQDIKDKTVSISDIITEAPTTTNFDVTYESSFVASTSTAE
ncbi:MAG: BMP family ABC transporter substrate-binding protein [Firmicutes bacterium]|uniref:BMP family ABC transporter substrate-binding protein n=1 Tax=Candidatus Onthovivens merdipullorum TaxID=2840889 RepID=A0A9D9DGM5_9BACL|nr:BMP family ABC transporter substrate-binding protein [Candidatus Onthovivens merdipullorum]